MNANNLDSLKIIAAGGGNTSRTSAPAMHESLSLTGKDKPSVLIIPTAKRTLETYQATIPHTETFFRKLGLAVTILHQFEQSPVGDQAHEAIEAADMIYTAGGDTLHLMEVLKQDQLDQHIGYRALRGEVVLSGISAGAILPMRWGHSDSLSFRPETADTWDYIPVDGLGIAPIAITAHYSNHHERLGKRSDQFNSMLAKQRQDVGFGVDDYAAIKINEGKLSQFQSDPNHFVHIVRLGQNGEYDQQPLTAADSIDLASIDNVA